MSTFIGGAWPYANGSLHLGHVAGLLPGDILARYYRTKGENVLYVSGSDCNGTPIAIRAKQEGVTAKEIADYYHEEFERCFKELGFTYDCYTRTDAQHHHETVQKIFLRLLEEGFIYKKTVEQAYCETCTQFLPDRYVEGVCPHCHEPARGDQCDACSAILDPLDLLEKKCKLCENTPAVKETEHFYFALHKFQQQINDAIAVAKREGAWRDNAIQLTERYLEEGLQDRAVSRDLPIGVPIPVKGYEDKKIYVWIEAVAGYYSASKRWAEEMGEDDGEFWSSSAKTYYVHGKDNIPFHSIIWPAVLLGIGEKAIPRHIVSNEYLTVEKRKLSTSKNWAVWVPDILERYDPDSIRYFLTINAPENRDTNFSWREFIYSHNSELLGAYGNFVNRTLKFIEKYYDGAVPKGHINPELKERIEELYRSVGNAIEQAHFKVAVETIFETVRFANKYFDEQAPWKQREEESVACEETIYTCVYFIVNFAQLLEPFLPFSSERVRNMLAITNTGWKCENILPERISHVQPLFERIDIKQIEKEVERLYGA
ncbi:methionine--tRNA ligase [Bacillus pseudomycoides]|uniref:Methionine--tRNA ligase n=1 Tax=Bacillus pseudomycoides TaxID=64104 RepID=A0A2B6JWR5_9BACI|nr:methionine--tRNA ligase [Bacillus pseudomycoides]PEA84293.1 methionine--tRNA ligase [Bacillus pseudomycoides]PED70580.1 methionine--tRNA ligase [Bacillus pseudomycoides]PEI43152.1 methionine--tRNA ligase [Bacillus pseudomycoides]PEJ77757.1 methionine--tRNA ligase [Bacillus pseudomycoides]PEM09313.1 methionine--tRNA ligase [Bacillus pseudomycoides]